MSYIIVGIIALLSGFGIGMLFYRKHKARLAELEAELAKLKG